MVTVHEKAPHILIVEDDLDIAELMRLLLNEAGYTTTIVDSGEEAMNHIMQSVPNLMLLDLHLPDSNGLEILQQVRARSFLPMIVVSGYGKERERVTALELGADDFLSKPFSSEELVARIKALIRRVEWTPKPETRLVVRRLELDVPRRQASVRGKRLHLTPIEYSILSVLMKRAGHVITHEDLLQAVWGTETDPNDFSVLRVNISRLRQKIEENPRRPTYIVTIPGQGYWMPTGKP